MLHGLQNISTFKESQKSEQEREVEMEKGLDTFVFWGIMHEWCPSALNASQVAAAPREALPKALPEEPLGRDRGLPLLLLLRKLHEPYYIKYHRHPRGSHIIHDVHIYSFAIWPTILSGTFYACLKMHEHNMTWYIKYHRHPWGSHVHINICYLAYNIFWNLLCMS